MHTGRAEKATSCLILLDLCGKFCRQFTVYRLCCFYTLEVIEEKGYLNQNEKTSNFFCRHKRNIY